MAARKGMSGVVRRLCLLCQGDNWLRVRECSEPSCPLHSCRLADDGDDAAFVACVRQFCLLCAGSPDAVEECTADRPMGGQPACPAHPYRNAEIPLSGVHSGPVQQVRPLPGLGDLLASARTEQGSAAPANTEAAGDKAAAPAVPMARREGLSFTISERAPEAPDI